MTSYTSTTSLRPTWPRWRRPAAEDGFRAYNVGSGEVHTVGEMAAALAAVAGGPQPVVTGRYRLGDVRHVTADSARLRRELGWRPRVSFGDGMAEFAAAPQRAAAGEVLSATRH